MTDSINIGEIKDDGRFYRLSDVSSLFDSGKDNIQKEYLKMLDAGILLKHVPSVSRAFYFCMLLGSLLLILSEAFEIVKIVPRGEDSVRHGFFCFMVIVALYAGYKWFPRKLPVQMYMLFQKIWLFFFKESHVVFVKYNNILDITECYRDTGYGDMNTLEMKLDTIRDKERFYATQDGEYLSGRDLPKNLYLSFKKNDLGIKLALKLEMGMGFDGIHTMINYAREVLTENIQQRSEHDSTQTAETIIPASQGFVEGFR